jgi:hypothetical protein
MEAVLQFIIANGQELVGALLSVVGGLAVVARFTPNKSDDRIIQLVLDLLNFGGMNHGKAANKE